MQELKLGDQLEILIGFVVMYKSIREQNHMYKRYVPAVWKMTMVLEVAGTIFVKFTSNIQLVFY